MESETGTKAPEEGSILRLADGGSIPQKRDGETLAESLPCG